MGPASVAKNGLTNSPTGGNFLAADGAYGVAPIYQTITGITVGQLAPLYALGLAGPSAAGVATPVFVILAGTFWGFLIHADIRWRCRPLEWLVSTPVFHHWHHSRVEHINRNYASMLPVLDRVFGTYYLPNEWPKEVGIEAPHPATLTGQLMEPLQAPKAMARSHGA